MGLVLRELCFGGLSLVVGIGVGVGVEKWVIRRKDKYAKPTGEEEESSLGSRF